ncbi:biotin/lipoyl-binding protein [Nocardioides rotundus]|uniref:acetyl-CoA carboxylase biotin carboxyl carrier protein n=1 Tax=Nocardioides rotundus TaxID=1774216 RepID=UPI001CBD2CD5|nr:biotin/lipoyl-containing protein [Nocardioides rotundus]UAL29947.1 biotin/lipoyl-binding protein [Nocardioides rotundus]
MDDVQVVLAAFDESEWDELRIDSGDFHLHVFKSSRFDRPASTLAPASVGSAAATRATAASATSAPAPTAAAPHGTPDGGQPIVEDHGDGVVVRAPSLGTFYRAPKPGADPYVEVGTQVTASSQLALLEVMKLYTAVEAGVDGVVTKILVEDGGLVEHDQPLFVIDPGAA